MLTYVDSGKVTPDYTTVVLTTQKEIQARIILLYTDVT